jgi:hypothetical protein
MTCEWPSLPSPFLYLEALFWADVRQIVVSQRMRWATRSIFPQLRITRSCPLVPRPHHRREQLAGTGRKDKHRTILQM